MNDAGQFYTNRVLKDWKEKDKRHVDWVKSWVQTLTELQAFVKQHHTTGMLSLNKQVLLMRVMRYFTFLGEILGEM